MPVFAVQYEYADQPEALDELRPKHRAYLAGLLEAGTLLASGPYSVEPGSSVPAVAGSGALLLVRAESAEAVLGLLEADPFFGADLIAARSARGWIPVFGPLDA